MTCSECKYFRKGKEGLKSFCHKNPPHAGMGWPMVMADDWCGEFDDGSAEIEFCSEGNCH